MFNYLHPFPVYTTEFSRNPEACDTVYFFLYSFKKKRFKITTNRHQFYCNSYLYNTANKHHNNHSYKYRSNHNDYGLVIFDKCKDFIWFTWRISWQIIFGFWKSCLTKSPNIIPKIFISQLIYLPSSFSSRQRNKLVSRLHPHMHDWSFFLHSLPMDSGKLLYFPYTRCRPCTIPWGHPGL